jgi:RNA recognition motif-containing protein
MGKRLFVENLPPDMGEADLAAAFSNYGTVVLAEVVVDKDSGESRGFGFVEMETEDQAETAMIALHDHEIENVKLQVSVDRPRPQTEVMPPKPAEPW